jgi:hypothetical protein
LGQNIKAESEKKNCGSKSEKNEFGSTTLPGSDIRKHTKILNAKEEKLVILLVFFFLIICVPGETLKRALKWSKADK